jgi:hypothetical protein
MTAGPGVQQRPNDVPHASVPSFRDLLTYGVTRCRFVVLRSSGHVVIEQRSLYYKVTLYKVIE